MDCETSREALSARLDGEAEPVPAATIDAHLDGCDDCRRWQDGAAALTRSLRLRPAADVPDLADAVLAAAPDVLATAPDVPRGNPTRGWPPRIGLAGVAIAQVALGLGQLLGSEVPRVAMVGDGIHRTSGGHLFNESTAWNLALGVGLLWAALRPRATTGMMPVVAGFLAVLGVLSANDLAEGDATLARVMSHAILLLGLVLLVVVHRGVRGPDDGRTASPLPDTPDLPDTGDLRRSPPKPAQRPRPRLRPVGWRRAA